MRALRVFIALVAVLVATGCGSKQQAPAESLTGALPVQVQREWRLHDATLQTTDGVPETVKALGVKNWVLAHYQANGTVTVRLFELGSQTSAFEAAQKWHEPSSLGFHNGRYFVTAESDRLSREELAGFVQDLQQNLKTK